MHATFIILFLGSNASWTNYVYMLIMGVSAMTVWSAAAVVIAIPLVGLAIMGQNSILKFNFHGWLQTRPSAITADLWVGTDEQREWEAVMNLARGRRTVCLSSDGAASLLFSISNALWHSLDPRANFHLELDVNETIIRRTVAVLPKVARNLGFLDHWTQFETLLQRWKIVFQR